MAAPTKKNIRHLRYYKLDPTKWSQWNTQRLVNTHRYFLGDSG